MSTIDMLPSRLEAMPTSRSRWIFVVALSMVACGVLYEVYWWSSEFYGQGGPQEHQWVKATLPEPEVSGQYPARLISTVTQPGTNATYQSALTSLAGVSTKEYQTNIYDNELTTSGSVAQDIIQTNVVSKEHRLTIEPSQNRHISKHTPTHEQERRTGKTAIAPARRNHDTHSTALEEH